MEKQQGRGNKSKRRAERASLAKVPWHINPAVVIY